MKSISRAKGKLNLEQEKMVGEVVTNKISNQVRVECKRIWTIGFMRG